MLQEEPHQVTKMVNLPLLSTLMISVILVLGPQPPRSTIQLHPMSPALIKLYLSTLSQCTLVSADLLDTLQTLIQAAQQTKAKVQHHYHQPKFIARIFGHSPKSFAASLNPLQRKSKHWQQIPDNYTQYLLGSTEHLSRPRSYCDLKEVLLLQDNHQPAVNHFSELHPIHHHLIYTFDLFPTGPTPHQLRLLLQHQAQIPAVSATQPSSCPAHSGLYLGLHHPLPHCHHHQDL